MSESDLLSKKILVVVAHPDDESFTAGGTLLRNIDEGGSNFLFCATLGEKGKAHLDSDYSDEELRIQRKEELVSASKVLGISNIEIGIYPDGSVNKYETELVTRLSERLERLNPDVIVGFGIDGYTGHADHVATFKAGIHVAREFNTPYYAFSLPPEPLATEFRKYLLKKRICDVYEDNDSHQEVLESINIDGAKKLEALRCYKSQWKGLDPLTVFPQNLAEHFLSHEYFSRLA